MTAPLVMCLTNTVAANFTANVLLAIGAKPAMIEEVTEAVELAGAASAILVNLGTLTPAQAHVQRSVLMALRRQPKPWVLDPVACHLLAYRRRIGLEFLAEKPTLVRGNHAEVDFMRTAGGELSAAVTWLSTGAEDRLFAPSLKTPETIRGGTARLQDVTATGCSQGAICAALLGRGFSPLEAARAAAPLMKDAGERAAAVSDRPGTFQAALLDALWELSAERGIRT